MYVTIALELTMNLDKWIPCHIPYDISGLKIHHFCCYQWILFMHSKNVWKRTKKKYKASVSYICENLCTIEIFQIQKWIVFFSRNESDTSKSGPIPQHQVAVLVKVYHWSGGALSLDPVVGVRSYLWVPEGTPEHSIIVGSYHTGDAFLGLWGNDKCWYMYVYVTEGVQVFSFFVILTTHISNLDHMSICSTVIFGSFSKFLIWNCLSCNGHIWTMYRKLTLSTVNYFADFYNTNQKQICWKFKLALFYSTIIVI